MGKEFDGFIGKRIGMLTAIKQTNKRNKNRSILWEFRCDCGNTVLYPLDWVFNGTTRSCGCNKFHFDDLTGERFGRLTVLEYAGRHGKGNSPYWKCVCDCGKETYATRAVLKRGRKQSCGCIRSEMLSSKNRKHGGSKSRLYNIWCGMKERCSNKNQMSYKNYGGRGISVCAEWLNSFQSFFDWAMASGYSDELSIDRIDNSLGYRPDNCRWATKVSQANNTRANRFITYGGETLTVSEWGKKLGFPSNLISGRLHRGWTEKEAIEIPYGHHRKEHK